jgi:hypothetical protein
MVRDLAGYGLYGLMLTLACAASALQPAIAADPLEELLGRTSQQVASFLDLISEVNCAEHVTQEKLNDSGKTVEKEESSFDYLILLSNGGGELDLVESRIAANPGRSVPKDKSPLLVSNGFSTLFLIFHPYYSSAFQFSAAGEETVGGESLARVHFQHIPGMRSPAALAVRGREYPLDISGEAWIDPHTGVIRKIAAGIDSGMEDVGLRSLHCEINYAPIFFHDSPEPHWLPAQAMVEVQSLHQHWRNTHSFSQYKHFSVNTKEQIAQP